MLTLFSDIGEVMLRSINPIVVALKECPNVGEGSGSTYAAIDLANDAASFGARSSNWSALQFGG